MDGTQLDKALDVRLCSVTRVELPKIQLLDELYSSSNKSLFAPTMKIRPASVPRINSIGLGSSVDRFVAYRLISRGFSRDRPRIVALLAVQMIKMCVMSSTNTSAGSARPSGTLR